MTYEGMLVGVPSAEENDRIISRAMEAGEKIST
jgi:hypothetical protein